MRICILINVKSAMNGPQGQGERGTLSTTYTIREKPLFKKGSVVDGLGSSFQVDKV